MSDDKTSADAGLLVEGNLLACGAGMSDQHRQDVKNAFHFATLAADKVLDIEKDGKAWYDKFLDAMRDVGFTTPKRSFEMETSTELSVTLGAVAVRVIGAAGSALLGGTAVGELAKKAFDKLTKRHPHRPPQEEEQGPRRGGHGRLRGNRQGRCGHGHELRAIDRAEHRR